MGTEKARRMKEPCGLESFQLKGKVTLGDIDEKASAALLRPHFQIADLGSFAPTICSLDFLCGL